MSRGLATVPQFAKALLVTCLRASFRRHWWLALLLLLGANLARAAVPTGYMPGAGTDGSITIKLCSGASWQMPLDKAAHDPTERERSPSHPCAFAGLTAGAALPPPSISVSAPSFVTVPVPALSVSSILRLAIQRPRPPARAPPSSV